MFDKVVRHLLLDFTLDTHGTYVGELCDELLPMVELARSWAFPYDIQIVWRVLPQSYNRKTFRRFDSRDRVLYLDMSIIYERYDRMSKNEQREALGIFLYDYLSASIAKYKQHADLPQQTQLREHVKLWLVANDWLDGKLGKARMLLAQETSLYEVSRQLQLPLEEVEHLYLRMHQQDQPEEEE